MSDLQAYLAAKYMSGAKADAILERSGDAEGKRRKKKRKVDAGGSGASGSGGAGAAGLVIADDDGMAWGKKDEDEEEYKPVVEERRGQFKAKSKADSWATIREADPELRPRTPTPELEDEAPYVVSTTVEAAPRGGLQSAADLRAEQARKEAEMERKRQKAIKEEEKRKREAKERGEDEDDDPNATVYRDASGRRIDMKVAKAEKAKQERERMEKEMAKMEWGKGLVQKEDREKAKREADALKAKGIARYADDADMNEELREVERWNDPAAAFLTKKRDKKTSRGPKFPSYTGPPPPPNRFAIPPGYRWDGVDRGNGFEAKLMQKRNSRGMQAAAYNAWSMEDM
ncbi:hypothetical protein JCM10213_006816 [Rhodosporidiobolus nylandii]